MENTNLHPEELIILGNGFDLACELKSSYKDFFNQHLNSTHSKLLTEVYTAYMEIHKNTLTTIEEESRHNYSSNDRYEIARLDDKENLYLNAMEKYNGDVFGYFKVEKELKSISFFDVFFFITSLKNENYNPNWSDVETAIQSILIDEDIQENNLSKQNLPITIKNLSENSNKNIKIKDKDIFFLIDVLEELQQKLNSENIEKIILSSLIQFEDNFKNYLTSTIKHHTDYFIYAEELFKKITKSKKVNILSFNYTNPFKVAKLKNEVLFLNMENVHGSLDKNIIFGIDETSIAANDKVYRFSKTYRIMNNLTDSAKNDSPLLDKNIKKIKFYGHSLSEMDYSYFQSIFDFYDLYGSNIQLIFYYSIYDDAATEEIKENYLQAITKMIHKYGDTMNNKDHGRNLQHKLLLEKRIHLVCI
ncbi:conserved hypothetical protein [Brochothrix thermosphacta]|uniref:AbiH family protein n=1 Tax=Brochothrix thermosphacta TaxID=2756 RepID=UPI000D7A30F0|nr:AbiH family protein [Brochothrix thermosphacta]SPP25747.1 conserved hypothetical protein [Brochothrix thermosphacta]